jgi:hypothetical protein
MNQLPTKELILEFSIENVKANIEKVVEAGKPFYSFVNKNDVFNTYRITIVSGMLSGILNVSLRKIDDNKTEWKSEIMKTVGGGAQIAIFSRFQDEFLNILAKGLSGEEVNKELVSSNKSGCLGIVIFILLLLSVFTKIITYKL